MGLFHFENDNEEFEFYTRPCPIGNPSNPYHDGKNCEIIIKGSEQYHRYKNIPVSHGKDCKLFVDLMDVDEKYEYLVNINGGVTLDLQIIKGYKIHDILTYASKSPTTFTEVIKIILLAYNRFKSVIGKYHFDKYSLYDIGIIEGFEKLFFFRPVKMIHMGLHDAIEITDRAMEVEFLSNFRELIFNMLKVYMKREETNRISNNKMKVEERRVKDARSCSLENWRKFPEFKCSSLTPNTCPIYNRYFVNGIWCGGVGNTLCTHVIEKILDDHADRSESYIHFECQFSRLSEHKTPENNPINSLYNIIGTRVAWHRLCIHKNFLTMAWMKWVVNDVFKLSIPNYEIER